MCIDKMTPEKLDFVIAQYLPFKVKFAKVVNAYYGGRNPKSYLAKRGKFAYMEKRVGTVIGITGDKVRTTIGYFDFRTTERHNLYTHITNFEEYKLSLRPMSELDREELFKHFDDHVDYLTTEREYWIGCSGRKFWLESIPLSHYFYLLENHYDVFGLIDLGLAFSHTQNLYRKNLYRKEDLVCT